MIINAWHVAIIAICITVGLAIALIAEHVVRRPDGDQDDEPHTASWQWDDSIVDTSKEETR